MRIDDEDFSVFFLAFVVDYDIRDIRESSFHLLIQFQFKFLQSSCERKRCIRDFYVLDRVNDNVRVRTSLHCFVF